MSWVLKLVPAQVAPLFSLFSQKAHSVFVIMIIVSIIFILIGVVALIFGWKMKFKDNSSEKKDSLQIISQNQLQNKAVSKEEVREIVKEELSKKKIRQVNKPRQKKKN
jgi:ABC-type lipoprotein release transport system permease subunit